MPRKPPEELKTILCEVCGKSSLKDSYAVRRNKHNYCSFKCFKIGRVTRLKLSCPVCKKPFERQVSWMGYQGKPYKTVYCSRECKVAGSVGVTSPRKGIKSGPNWKLREGAHWNYGRGTGKSTFQVMIRTSALMGDWRVRVFERDGYQCTRCNSKVGGHLHAHHTIFFSKLLDEFLETYDAGRDFHQQISAFGKFWEVANGITVCTDCHKRIHTKLGNGNNKPRKRS